MSEMNEEFYSGDNADNTKKHTMTYVCGGTVGPVISSKHPW